MKNKAKAANGDTPLANLYRRWSRPLIHAMQGKLGSRSRAEDTVHTVFARMAVNGQLPQEGKEFAYLMRAASNQMLDQHRQQAREQVHVVASIDADEGEGVADMARLSAGEVTRQHQHQQHMVRLREAIAELPPRQREAFVLHLVEGHTQQEVAEHMGITLRMVNRHVTRALAYCEMRLQYGSLEQMQRLRATDDKNPR